jgi:hypothetical protein
MKYFKIAPVIVLILFLVCSCKKETELPVDMGYKYFPVNTGHWVVYDVDSVSHNDFTGQIDSFKFQIKEYVESVFIDNEGRETQRLERYKRLNDTSAWFIKDVWMENLTTTTAEKVEENVRIIKLIFPPHENEKWDGNLNNTNGVQNYEYKDIHSAYFLNNITYDSTLSVIQKQEYTLISEKFEKEVFAAHIGLIYKKYVNLTKEPTGVIKKGIDYSYTLNSYGNQL